MLLHALGLQVGDLNGQAQQDLGDGSRALAETEVIPFEFATAGLPAGNGLVRRRLNNPPAKQSGHYLGFAFIHLASPRR